MSAQSEADGTDSWMPAWVMDHVHSLQHVLVAVNRRMGTPGGNLDWAAYHLKRALQGWKPEWDPGLLWADFASARARLEEMSALPLRGIDLRDPKAVYGMLHQLRAEAGLSQRELGQRLGKSKKWVSEVERGLSEARVDAIDAWARACGKVPVLRLTFADDAPLFHRPAPEIVIDGVRYVPAGRKE